MLLSETQRPLPHPRLDDEAFEEYVRRGFKWSDGEVSGVRFRWLTPPDWILAADLPAKGADGFTPVMGLAHSQIQAAIGLRYSRASFDFDPGDFLDAADPRPFDQATSYTLNQSVVAERVGTCEGKTIATAAHRRGPHLFMIAAELPEWAADWVRTGATAMTAGLLIKGEHPGLVERYQTTTSRTVSCSFERLARSTFSEGGGRATVQLPFPKARSEITLHVVSGADDPEASVAAELAALATSVAPPKPESVREGKLAAASPAYETPFHVRELELEGDREATVAAVGTGEGRVLVIRGLFPARRTSLNAWLSGRFSLARLIGTLRPSA
ncbi:hypothetical protein ACFL59_03550 [Planctomycetota bacterium]